LRVAHDARTAFRDGGGILKRLPRVPIQHAGRDGQDSALPLHPDRPPRLVGQEVGYGELAALGLIDRHALVEREIAAVQRHAHQHGLDLLNFDQLVRHALAVEAVRDDVRREGRKRDLADLFLVQQHALFGVRGHAVDGQVAVAIGEADVVVAVLDGAQVGGGVVLRSLALPRPVALLADRAAKLGVGLQFAGLLRVDAARDQVLDPGPATHGAVGRLAQAGGVRRDGEILARERLDADLAAQALLAQRDRAVLGLLRLDALAEHLLRGIGQLGRNGGDGFVPLVFLPPPADHAKAGEQAVLEGGIEHQEAGVLLEHQVLDVISLRLRGVFVLLALRDERGDVLTADEHLHDIGQHRLDGVGHRRIHHGRAVGQRRDVRHVALGVGQRLDAGGLQFAVVALAEADRPLALFADDLQQLFVIVAGGVRQSGCPCWWRTRG
jgi:hypothetical protein